MYFELELIQGLTFRIELIFSSLIFIFPALDVFVSQSGEFSCQ